MFDINKIFALQEAVNGTAPFNVLAQPTLFELQQDPVESDSEFDINRTEKQKNNLVSYDIGSVAGSRKELAALKKAYLDNKNRDQLAEIALLDDTLADELAIKKNIFSWFSMDSCMARNVDVKAAYGLHLLIRRLPNDSKGMKRDDYLNAMEFISQEFYLVKTIDELKCIALRLDVMAVSQGTLEHHERTLQSMVERLERLNTSPIQFAYEITRLNNSISLRTCYIESANLQHATPVHQLGDFTQFITSSKKVNDWWKSIHKKYHSWDDYTAAMKERTDKVAPAGGNTKKLPVWERALPENPIRISHVPMPTIMVPEDYVGTFKFRANQMGHWMKDGDALGHLRNSGSGFVDLAHLLNIPVEAVSLKGSLAMAFGARGTGRALAHFERGIHRNVINMTKTKGSLGVLAHEWFHAFDYFLRNQMDQHNPNEMLSEVTEDNYDILPSDVWFALMGLISAMKEGTCTDYYMIDPNERISVTHGSVISFASCDYDMQRFVDLRMSILEENLESILRGYNSKDMREKAKKRHATRRKAELKTACLVAAHLHREYTGKEVIVVPYTLHQTLFYTNAIRLDRGKVRNAYWSSNVELMARAFEAYIQREMKNKDMQNDYLVCGASGVPYPNGDELDRICEAFKAFLDVTRDYLVNE